MRAIVSNGVVYFDSTCGLCTAGTTAWAGWLGRHGFAVEPFPIGARPAEMEMRDAAGRLWGGIDALGQITRTAWYGWPFYALTRLPVSRQLLAFGYRQVARRRQRISTACGLRPLNALRPK